MAASDAGYLLALPEFSQPVKLLIVVAPYYKAISEALLAGATATASACGAVVEVIEVPGARELPATIALAERMAKYDGYVALGCVIRGETIAYETLCRDIGRGLSMLGLQGAAVGNGVVTVENLAQAEVRAEPAGRNKGGQAAAAALHLIALSRKWASDTKGIGFRP